MSKDARQRQRRLRQVAIAVGLVVAVAVVGQVIVWLPDKAEVQPGHGIASPTPQPGASDADTASRPVSRAAVPELIPADQDAVGHARTAREREIAQRFDQAVSMLYMRQYDYAMAALHRVLELAPKMPEAHVNMGYALLGLEQYEGAYDFFETATVLRPSQANAYYGMALALKELGATKAAIEAMETYTHLETSETNHLREAVNTVTAWRAAYLEQLERELAEPETDASESAESPSDGDDARRGEDETPAGAG